MRKTLGFTLIVAILAIFLLWEIIGLDSEVSEKTCWSVLQKLPTVQNGSYPKIYVDSYSHMRAVGFESTDSSSTVWILMDKKTPEGWVYMLPTKAIPVVNCSDLPGKVIDRDTNKTVKAFLNYVCKE
jgi:hypothetical protein